MHIPEEFTARATKVEQRRGASRRAGPHHKAKGNVLRRLRPPTASRNLGIGISTEQPLSRTKGRFSLHSSAVHGPRVLVSLLRSRVISVRYSDFFDVSSVKISGTKQATIRMWQDPPGGGCKIPAHIITMLLLALLALTNVAFAEDESMGPVFVKEPPNRVDFSNGTGAVVECQARGNPKPDLIWVRADGTAVGDVPGLRQVLPNGNLVFPPFRAEDYRQEVHAQVYSCLARSPAGSVHSRDVNVRAVVQQFYETRVIDEFVLRGNTATLKCLVPSFAADFIDVIEWLADDGSTYVPTNQDEEGILNQLKSLARTDEQLSFTLSREEHPLMILQADSFKFDYFTV